MPRGGTKVFRVLNLSCRGFDGDAETVEQAGHPLREPVGCVRFDERDSSLLARDRPDILGLRALGGRNDTGGSSQIGDSIVPDKVVNFGERPGELVDVVALGAGGNSPVGGHRDAVLAVVPGGGQLHRTTNAAGLPDGAAKHQGAGVLAAGRDKRVRLVGSGAAVYGVPAGHFRERFGHSRLLHLISLRSSRRSW